MEIVDRDDLIDARRRLQQQRVMRGLSKRFHVEMLHIAYDVKSNTMRHTPGGKLESRETT
jgi:hypothetical protein